MRERRGVITLSLTNPPQRLPIALSVALKPELALQAYGSPFVMGERRAVKAIERSVP
jgi:hypothetical protein